MVDLTISEDFKAKWPSTRLACLETNVQVFDFSTELWFRIEQECKQLRETLSMEQISQQLPIASSRKCYRALGKDPARYRLSAEALKRRVIKGDQLYQINNVVDVVNLASVISGFSIGAYDVGNINGAVVLSTGSENEAYVGLGRGQLNIANLPVLRDTKGAFGSPTSDSPRTSVTQLTRRVLMVYFGFGAHNLLEGELARARELLLAFANAKNFETCIIE